VKDEGVEFLVSFSMQSGNLDAKDRVKTISTSSSTLGSASGKPDPFDKNTLDPDLVVSKVAPSYTLVLNKFNTVKDHALLVTERFEPQNSALTSQDLEAWYWTIDVTNSIGFYNSNYIAGASQRHKHLQIIPLDVMFSLRPDDAATPLPIDDIISNIVDDGTPSSAITWEEFHDNEVYSIPSFASFKHGIALLQSPEQRSSKNEFYGDYLNRVYLSLLAANDVKKGPCWSSSTTMSTVASEVEDKAKDLGLDMKSDAYCTGYNLIMSRQWMMVVPRRKRDYDGHVGVNGFGFVGLLLARDEQTAKKVQTVGPMQVLNDVTFPSSS
jgi:ATP adenylyltransferase